ncbi:MAG: PKD domain-containing protein [Methanolinea sp.]|nr:PKD domain-containing protein [Methanolinea sp.]
MIIDTRWTAFSFLAILILSAFTAQVTADTLVVYPAVDGAVFRTVTGSGDTYTNLRNGNGTGVSVSYTYPAAPSSQTLSTTLDGKFYGINRGIFSFNTSSLPDDCTIDGATFSIYGHSKRNELGTIELGITGGTLIDNESISAGDYLSFGSTEFTLRRTPYNKIATGKDINHFTFNAAGIGYVDRTGYTVLYLRDNWDLDNSFGGTWVNASQSNFRWYDRDDDAGYTPYFTITYSTGIYSAPVANFTSDTQNGTAPLDVQFIDLSANTPTSWAWDFNNDGTVDSTDQNPSHTFETEGTYTVNLTVSNAAGSDEEVMTGYITVVAAPVPPVAGFTSDVQAGTAPLTVHFTDLSSNTPTSWAWDFNNDGIVDSTEQNSSHIYSTAGTFTVNLTVSNAAGADGEVRTDFITVDAAPVAPVAGFTTDVQTGTAPLTVQFTDTSTGDSITSYQWIFGDDPMAVYTDQSLNHTFTNAGAYSVNHSAGNAAGTSWFNQTGIITVTSPGPTRHYAVFRPSSANNWIFTDDLTGVKYRDQYGTGTDKPLTGDFDNDGMTDRAVFRGGQWIVDLDLDGDVDSRTNYGLPTDIPLVGDFNNDGTTDRGVFRNGQWIIDWDMDSDVDFRSNYGTAGDIPLAGDFNNDGSIDRAVVRKGQWIVDLDLDGDVDSRTYYGLLTDVPLVGFFDDNTLTDRAVIRNGQWIIDYGMDNSVDSRLAFGIAGDTPLSWLNT